MQRLQVLTRGTRFGVRTASATSSRLQPQGWKHGSVFTAELHAVSIEILKTEELNILVESVSERSTTYLDTGHRGSIRAPASYYRFAPGTRNSLEYAGRLILSVTWIQALLPETPRSCFLDLVVGDQDTSARPAVRRIKQRRRMESRSAPSEGIKNHGVSLGTNDCCQCVLHCINGLWVGKGPFAQQRP